MAVLKVNVQGGSDFGGYLSVNGNKEMIICNGCVYNIPSGNVHFDYYSRSSAERKMGNLNAAVNGGSLIGSAIAANGMGDSYSLSFEVDDNDIVEFTAYVKGNRNVYAAPVVKAIPAEPGEIKELLENSRRTVSAASQPAYNPAVALVLCLLLGFLGVHQFYMKKTGKGILYLFTFGLFGIGVLIDLIKLIVETINSKK